MGRLAWVRLLIFHIRRPVRDPVRHVQVVLSEPWLALVGHSVALRPSPRRGEAANADAAWGRTIRKTAERVPLREAEGIARRGPARFGAPEE
jgi:hypothetical protein